MVDFKHQLGVLNYVAFTADNKIYNYFVDNGFSATVKCETNNLVDTNDLLIIQTQTADFKTTSEDTFTIVNGNSKIHFKPSTGAILREWHMLGRADIPKADVANEINHYAASASSKTYKFRLDE